MTEPTDALSAERYRRWIAANVPLFPRGLCAEMTARMVEAFPELRRVRGHVESLATGHAMPHWWCETPAGAVVDPTAAQFEGYQPVDYQEHVGAEPIGKCLNCGDYVFVPSPSSDFCSDACCNAMTNSLNGALAAKGSLF